MSGYCVIYLRCSTKKQSTEGLSLQLQIKECESLMKEKKLKRRGLEFDEGISGATLKSREGLNRALSLLQKGDVLLVYSISRLMREDDVKMHIRHALKEKEAKILSVTEYIEDAVSGELMIDIFSAIYKQERKTIMGRVKSGMATKKQKCGTSNMKAKYGYKYDKNQKDQTTGHYLLVPVPYEQRVISEIKRLRNQQYISPKAKSQGEPTPYSVIAEYLTDQGYHTRYRDSVTGQYKKWHASTVRNIFEAEKNKETLENLVEEDTEDKPIVKDVVYLVDDGATRYIDSAVSPIEILSKEGNNKWNIDIFPCIDHQSALRLIINWTKVHKYIVDGRENILKRDVDKNLIIKELIDITECDPIATTVDQIPIVFQN